jgi:hypothetical protein
MRAHKRADFLDLPSRTTTRSTSRPFSARGIDNLRAEFCGASMGHAPAPQTQLPPSMLDDEPARRREGGGLKNHHGLLRRPARSGPPPPLLALFTGRQIRWHPVAPLRRNRRVRQVPTGKFRHYGVTIFSAFLALQCGSRAGFVAMS